MVFVRSFNNPGILVLGGRGNRAGQGDREGPGTIRQSVATKAVSWIPIKGWVISDKTQHRKMRFKLVLVDVEQDHWV